PPRLRIQLLELATLDDVVALVQDLELTGYRFGRETLVAGDHHGADAGRGELVDGLLDTRRGRVAHAGEADERQVVEAVLADRVRIRAHCEAEHAQSAGGHRTVPLEQTFAHVLVDVDDAISREHACAELDDPRWRTLHI